MRQGEARVRQGEGDPAGGESLVGAASVAEFAGTSAAAPILSEEEPEAISRPVPIVESGPVVYEQSGQQVRVAEHRTVSVVRCRRQLRLTVMRRPKIDQLPETGGDDY